MEPSERESYNEGNSSSPQAAINTNLGLISLIHFFFQYYSVHTNSCLKVPGPVNLIAVGLTRGFGPSLWQVKFVEKKIRKFKLQKYNDTDFQ